MKKLLSMIFVLIFALSTITVTAVENEFCSVELPATIYGVVDKEMNIYFDNIVMCNNIKNYQIDVVCDKGIQQNERWTYTPTSAVTFPITINVFKNGTQLVDSAVSQIVIKEKSISNATKKVLFIGDSWTENVFYVNHVKTNFEDVTEGDNIKLVGTMTNWNNDSLRYEGRGGWSTETYCNKAEQDGKTNLFLNPDTKKFDFSYYLTNSKIETPDMVVLFLGINDVGQNVPIDTTIQNLKDMITSIHHSDSNIKIGIPLTPTPAGAQDGFGKNNACGSTRFSQKWGAYKLMQAQIINFDNKINNVGVIPVNVNIDSINNYGYEEVKANAYSNVMIKRLVDNVHPVDAGYYQCGDMIYGYLKSLY